MFGHTAISRRTFVYPNSDPTKIQVKTFGQMEGVCFTREGATCTVSRKGKTLIVTSTFPKLLGAQTFTFDANTAHMTFGVGGLDGGQQFSGTCQRKID